MKKFIVVMALIAIVVIAFLNFNDSKFTTNKWVVNTDSRYKMVESLESSYQLKGMTQQEIVDFLGNPDVKWEHDFENGHYIYYQYYIGKNYKIFEFMWEPNIYLVTFCDGYVVSTSIQPT